jgi:hypothetical protein
MKIPARNWRQITEKTNVLPNFRRIRASYQKKAIITLYQPKAFLLDKSHSTGGSGPVCDWIFKYNLKPSTVFDMHQKSFT